MPGAISLKACGIEMLMLGLLGLEGLEHGVTARLAQTEELVVDAVGLGS